MAMIHINRNRENLGKFTDQEVADGLKSGRFLPTDLAWQEPMPSWQPLSSFTDLPEPTPEGEQAVLVASAPLESSGNIEPAWERETGFSLGAGIQTVKQVFSAPTATFQKIGTASGILRSFFYFLFFSMLGSVCAFFYDFIAVSINPNILLERLGEFAPLRSQIEQLMSSMGTQDAITTIFVSSTVIQFFFLLAGIFISSFTAHFFLMVSGAAEKNFQSTFKAIAYSSGSGFVLQIVPLIGVPLSWIAFLVLGLIALKEVHQTSYWRVALSILIMLSLCCGAVLVLGLGLGALAANLPK